ncbi:MAG: rhomboid family intramembrane serine protease [Defluviimonas sp.]|nr:rhomboid family intramembrane serine protease [Defluviimonas sp.]
MSEAGSGTRSLRERGALVAILAACVLVEAALQLAGLTASPAYAGLLRQTAYEYGAFWPGLLRDWQPNYPGQPLTMFASYAFLHGGLVHLAMNMLTLWSLGREVIARVGQRGFLAIYAVSAVGGALVYGWLAPGPQPMVGASGALFGLAGAMLMWNLGDRAERRMALMPVAQAVMLLIGINAVMWWAMQGQLAWQTHLGGALAGALLAPFLPRRPLAEEEEPG